MPGSEAALKELVSRVRSDLLKDRIVLKIAENLSG